MNERLRSPAVIAGAAVAAVVLIALIVALCSGGDDEPADTTVAASTTSSAAASTTTGAPTTTGGPTTTAVDTTTAPEAGATTTTPVTAAPTTAPPDTPSTTSPDTTAPPTTYPPSERPDGPFVRIGEDYFPFTPTECLIYDGLDAVITGPGEAPDGTPVHVSLVIETLRIDIGTQDPLEQMDNHWAAGEDYGGELEVSINNWLVHADAVVVHGPTGHGAPAELEAECSF